MHVEADFLHRHLHTSELPDHISAYQIESVERQSLHDPEVTPSGAHIYQELCSFKDTEGHTVVREATIAIPNSNVVEPIPYVVIATDPWVTGKNGLNRLKIKQLVDLGYPVAWLHHADHRSPLQRNKSITRSARQNHALLDNIGDTEDFSISEVIVDGYSRGGMTGEKFLALAPQHNRDAKFSILDAPCFAVDMSKPEQLATLLKQLPSEAKGIGSIAIRHLKHGLETGDLLAVPRFAATLNPHPKNIFHEIMWASALVNASVGRILEHVPAETRGIRNFFEADLMSQMAAYVDLYAPLKGVVVVAHDGPHVEGASPEYIYGIRQAQFSALGKMILQNEILDAEIIAAKARVGVSSLSVV